MLLSRLHKQWIALSVRARAEDRIARNLMICGYETELPRMPVCSSCARRCDGRPLFPGYLFCRFDAHNPWHLISTPGVRNVVSCGSNVLPVAEDEIRAVRIAAATARCKRSIDMLIPGSRVQVVTGPLAGIEGGFLREGGKARIVIAVSILSRAVSVELNEADTVVPLGCD
jgi:transcription termination/antitermination protein NusG